MPELNEGNSYGILVVIKSNPIFKTYLRYPLVKHFWMTYFGGLLKLRFG